MFTVDSVEPIGRVHAVHATHSSYTAEKIAALVYTEHSIVDSNMQQPHQHQLV